MAHGVTWTKTTLQRFIDEAMLNEDEIFIMENRVKGKPISWMASELNMSESNVHKMISKIKKKYDNVQAKDQLLPPRRSSEKETWMDTH